MATERAKPALRVWWSKRERDVMYDYDRSVADGHLMHNHMGPLLTELDRRGFDLATVRFTIRRKPEPDRKWLLDQIEAVAKERADKPEHRRVPPLEGTD